MKSKKGIIFVLLSIILVSSAETRKKAGEDGWRLRLNKEGVVIYTRPVPGTPFEEFKSETTVETSLFSLLSLWEDVSHYPEWMHTCAASRLISKPDRLSQFNYIKTDTPWPVSDRDNILFAEVTQDNKTHAITIELTGVPDHIPETKGIVRVKRAFGHVLLTPVAGGKVQVEFQFFMDPAGSIPAGIINIFLLDFPYKTMINMKEMVRKERYQKANYSFLKGS